MRAFTVLMAVCCCLLAIRDYVTLLPHQQIWHFFVWLATVQVAALALRSSWVIPSAVLGVLLGFMVPVKSGMYPQADYAFNSSVGLAFGLVVGFYFDRTRRATGKTASP